MLLAVRRKRDSAKILYTADRRAIENDEIYVEFLTGSHDALVVEDADHLLGARSNGNRDLHRFLTVADGVVQALGTKIVFTTNLHNIGDIDEALIRPGRCFAVVRTRGLSREETTRFLAALGGDLPNDTAPIVERAFSGGSKSVTTGGAVSRDQDPRPECAFEARMRPGLDTARGDDVRILRSAETERLGIAELTSLARSGRTTPPTSISTLSTRVSGSRRACSGS